MGHRRLLCLSCRLQQMRPNATHAMCAHLAGAPYSISSEPSLSSSINSPGSDAGSSPTAAAAAAAAAACDAAVTLPRAPSASCAVAAAAACRAASPSRSARSRSLKSDAPNSAASRADSVGSVTRSASSRPTSAASGAAASSKLPDCVGKQELQQRLQKLMRRWPCKGRQQARESTRTTCIACPPGCTFGVESAHQGLGPSLTTPHLLPPYLQPFTCTSLPCQPSLPAPPSLSSATLLTCRPFRTRCSCASQNARSAIALALALSSATASSGPSPSSSEGSSRGSPGGPAMRGWRQTKRGDVRRDGVRSSKVTAF